MEDRLSIAIETSCRLGGLALGRGERLLRVLNFDASSRHATHLVCRMEELLKAEGFRPQQVQDIYVSAGPGSFTGLRVGVTVARTLAQAVPGAACVAVPTALAVAENCRGLDWRNLGVVFDAREGLIYACLLRRQGESIATSGEPRVTTPAEFLAGAPRPLLLTGEGLDYHDLAAPDVTLADGPLRLPTAEGVWRVGRRLAQAGQFTEYHHLLPIYTRPPAVLH